MSLLFFALFLVVHIIAYFPSQVQKFFSQPAPSPQKIFRPRLGAAEFLPPTPSFHRARAFPSRRGGINSAPAASRAKSASKVEAEKFSFSF
jgi:hypothetical protein